MIFTLEALRAEQGDCLLVHYGASAGAVQRILVDGGPAGVYGRALGPRLAQLRPGGGRTQLRMAMVSHIDDDHIAGIVDLLDRMCERVDDGSDPEVEIGELWFNAFETLTGAGAHAPAAQVQSAATAAAAEAPGGESAAIAASVSQGVTVRGDAARLGIDLNPEFDDLVEAGDEGGSVVDVGDGLTFTVLAPSRPHVEALRAKWQEWELAHVERRKPDAQTAAYVDGSVYNLSSIVVLARYAGRTMLLCGDARGDHVLQGLRAAGALDADGRVEVDVLKLPHHGSSRNVAPGFFEAIRARHYVCSGNGRFGNPEIETLQMLWDARGDEARRWTLWITYGSTPDDGHDGKPQQLADFFAGKQADVRYGSEGHSVVVDLGDPLGA
ncbi:MAG: ComEC/Rec2 family competence protein [Solirubrobacteraceae bacterium]